MSTTQQTAPAPCTAEPRKPIPYHELTDCFCSVEKDTIIDMVNPYTGNSAINNTPMEEYRAEYPDVQKMTIDEWCKAKAERQRTPITWQETTEERYDDMLGAVPPAIMLRAGFLVGEAMDHDAGNGQPRYSAFRQHAGKHYESSRPITMAEFKAELQKPITAPA